MYILMFVFINFLDGHFYSKEWNKLCYLHILLSFILSNKKLFVEIADKRIIHILSKNFGSFLFVFYT